MLIYTQYSCLVDYGFPRGISCWPLEVVSFLSSWPSPVPFLTGIQLNAQHFPYGDLHGAPVLHAQGDEKYSFGGDCTCMGQGGRRQVIPRFLGALTPCASGCLFQGH